MSILDASGQPASQPTPDKEPQPQAAPVALEPRTVSIEDGAFRLRSKIEFDGIAVGGPERGKFEKAIDAIMGRMNSLSIRLMQLMVIGAVKDKRAETQQVVHGALTMVQALRQDVEGMLTRLMDGLDPVPSVVVAPAPSAVGGDGAGGPRPVLDLG